MKINPTTHLCYSLNLFPRNKEGYINTVKAILPKMCEIRRNLNLTDDTPFALGLWLDAESVEELQQSANLAQLKSLLADNNFYSFTINAFPYGKFHNGPIKENVYLPDWSSNLRLDFTCRVADILAELLPDNTVGSISTVPGAYKFHQNSAKLADIAKNLNQVAEHLAQIKTKLGKIITLGVEMEPDCIWETPQEFCEFRKQYLRTANSRKFIGVCYDTCHQELLEGTPGSGLQCLLNARVPIAKIQLSTALCGKSNTDATSLLKELANFADLVYLHQTRFFNSKQKIVAAYKDISDIENNSDLQTLKQAQSLVIHFHMPIFYKSISANFATAATELNKVIKLIINNPEICSNIEIETYTYNVLPEKIKPVTIEKMILKEYRYIMNNYHNGNN